MNNDPVNHPTHYGGKNNPYEAIKVIEAWDLDFCLGNTIKYISRANKKGSEIEDLKKAAWYLKRKIEKLDPTKEKEELFIFRFVPKEDAVGLYPIVIINTSFENAKNQMQELHKDHWHLYESHSYYEKQNQIFQGQYLILTPERSK